MSDVSSNLREVTLQRYERYLNPGLAVLLKFMGLEEAELQAEGCWVTATSGKRFLDCLGGPGVFTLGHRPPTVVAAVQAQLERMPLSSHILPNPLLGELGERLAEVTPSDLQFSFVCNSGAEAVEAALKLARAHTRRPHFVAAEGAFHGKTWGALSASGRQVYREPFEPLLPGFTHVPFGDAEALAAAVDEQTAAVILEPIQCEAGIRIPPDGYLQAAREICDRHGALLILDEIQTGLARTGKWLACDWEDVCPDLLTLGKALGGGVMPIGAVVARPPVWEVFADNPYLHTSTFGGSPLACAAALAALASLQEPHVAESCRARGSQLLEGCRELQATYPETVTAVRGRGLLVALEFADSDLGGLVISGLVQRRVLAAFALNAPQVLRLEPPAIITEKEVQLVLSALRGALADTAALLAD
ncbi:MAG: aminotransferase class III-fold pyridoxal phosphate-dependent enzyme [candidate division WS1 bacterium]|nr:aminotransferase class III-fold pyridoxal phosphate-dependent enzyme [candidate division WS1 bacterium]